MTDRERQRSTGELVGPDTGWVAAQFVLLGVAIVVSPLEVLLFGRAYVLGHVLIAIVVGLGLMLVALNVAGRAKRDLGDSASMSPTPLDDAELIDRGIYSTIRHPMYLAAIALVAGWGIVWGSLSGLVMAGFALGFFTLKARHEERLLVEHYPGYREYRRRVRARFVPGLW